MADINDLSRLVLEEMQAYTNEVDRVMQDEIEKKAKEVTKKLKNTTAFNERSGAKSYKRKFFLKKLAQGKGYVRFVIANRKFQLTHLLEEGHKVKNKKNGTILGKVKAYPHWNQAQKEVNELTDDIIRRLKK